MWESKGLSDKNIKPPASSDNSLAPSLNHTDFTTRTKLCDQCLKQDEVTFNHKTVVNNHIVYEINLWPLIQSSGFTLGNSLFGAVN